MKLVHLTMAQALWLWSELEAAIRGENQYGRHMAEIYAYRLDNTLRLKRRTENEREKAAKRASAQLNVLLAHFATERNARIWVDDVPLERWTCPPQEHRWHVRVEPKKEGEE